MDRIWGGKKRPGYRKKGSKRGEKTGGGVQRFLVGFNLRREFRRLNWYRTVHTHMGDKSGGHESPMTHGGEYEVLSDL